jgi:hypothetical protein
VALGDDPIAHRGVERDLEVGQQQCARIGGAETGHTQLGKPSEHVALADGAHCANQCDPLGEYPAPDEQEYLGRGDIEPLGVVDHAQQRLLFGDLRQQGQCGQPDQKPVRSRARLLAEYGAQGIALRDGQPIDVIEHRCAQLVQPAVGKLHLRFNPDCGADAPTVSATEREIQQSALACASLAAQYHGAATTLARVLDRRAEKFALGTASQRPHRGLVHQPTLHLHRSRWLAVDDAVSPRVHSGGQA